MKLLVIICGVFVWMSCVTTLPVNQDSQIAYEDARLLKAVSDDSIKEATNVDAINRKKRQSSGTAFAGSGTYESHLYGKYQYAGYGVGPGGIPTVSGNKENGNTVNENKNEKQDGNCNENCGGFGHGSHGFGNGVYGLFPGGQGFGQAGHGYGGNGFGYHGYGYGGGGYGYGGSGYGYGHGLEGYILPILGNIQVGVGNGGFGVYGGYGGYGGYIG